MELSSFQRCLEKKNYKRQWTQRAQDRLTLGIMKENCSEGEWSSTKARIQRGPVNYLLADFQTSTGPA